MKKHIKKLQIFSLVLVPTWAHAQESVAETSSSSVFSNPLFLTLLGVMIVLAILIGVLGKTILNLIKFKFDLGKKGKTVLSALLLTSFITMSDNLLASGGDIAGISPTAFWLIVTVILTELFIIFWFILVLYRMFEKEKVAEIASEETVTHAKTKKVSWFASMWDRMNDYVPIEKEKDVLLDHDYDGIKELDNNLPPWWKYGFYLTIVVAVVYLAWFHLLGGPSSSEELQRSIAQAEVERLAWEAANPAQVDANTVTFMNEPTSLAIGRELFIKHTCQTCHGEQGEGNMIGPNLTDEYWKNGGSIGHIFTTISGGVQGTAMQAWNKNMNSMEIAQLASYIMSLQGTNPPNAKEPEGEKYVPAEESDNTEEVSEESEALPEAVNEV